MAATSTLPTRSTQETPEGHCEVVLGVDTHKDVHVAVVVTKLGARLGACLFQATAAGYQEMLAWARSFGDLHHPGVEGTGSYGAALCRYLLSQNVQVIEVNRPDRAARRRSGKSDEVDAEAAARAVLGGRATARPKHTSGTVEDLRVSTTVKDSNATWPANSSDASAPHHCPEQRYGQIDRP
ncbi:transposase [Streptomyces sp. NPDC056704]|uniref:IS110 family transposase n=1 Tax=Streptomyces TaxID=1883 RepID=UPI00367BD8D8